MSRPSRHPLESCHESRALLDALEVSVVEWRCRSYAPAIGKEEAQRTHGIVFVRRGVFVREHMGERVVADASQVLFYNAGEPYRYAHPVRGGDDCTILTLSADAARALVESRPTPRSRRSRGLFPRGHGLASARAHALHWELLVLLRAGVTRLGAEDALAAVLDASAQSAYPEAIDRMPPFAKRARRRWREIAQEVQLLVSADVATPPSLTQLAARFDLSPFHLSRSFRRVTGVTLRQYLGRLRAQLAADRLTQGTKDLTGLALDLGFHDHSHFTNAFRAAWGMPPSEFRRRLHPR